MAYFSAQYHNLVCTHSVILVIENLIGSLSRTIQNIRLLASGQCVSSVFFLFFREWSFKNRQYPRVDIFKARKDFEGFKTAFFHLLLLSFVVDGLFTTPVYSPRRGRFVNSAFPNVTRKIWPRNEVYLWQTNLKANVCRNSTFQVNTRKNATWRRRLTSRNRIAIFVSTSSEERHNKPFRL